MEGHIGAGAYSYVYYGQAGNLDRALANSSLAGQVTIWHINSDEPRVLDYNEEYKSPGQVTSLYSGDAHRSSDHDPVIVGLAQKHKQLLGGRLQKHLDTCALTVQMENLSLLLSVIH